MVGRSQKQSEQKHEIEILDDGRKRRGLKQSKLKRPVREPEQSVRDPEKRVSEPEKLVREEEKPARELEAPKTDDSELFADFDLEGVSEEEKAEIKKAILLSREEEKKSEGLDVRWQRGEKSADVTPHQNTENEISSTTGSMDFDNETQPPDSPVQDRLTSVEDQANFEREPTQNSQDEKVRPSESEVFDISTEVDDEEERPKEAASPSFNLRISMSENEMDETDGHIHGQFNGRRQDDKEQIPDEGGQFQSSLPFTQAFSTRPRPSGTDSSPDLQFSTEGSQAVGRSGFQSTQGAEGNDEDRSQASLSQESEGSKADGEERESKEEVVSSSPGPLKRHYKNVRKKNISQPKYFASDNMDPVHCTKVIMQLFDIYAKNVRSAQEKCAVRMLWGEPVKSGQHQSKTIDVKRRGQGSQYMILSDSDDETIKSDLPKENDKSDAMKGLNNNSRRRAQGEMDNNNILTAETQEYDPYNFSDVNTNQNFEDIDDKDFCPNVSVRMRMHVKQDNNIEAKETKDKIVGKPETKRGRGRGGRRNRSKVLAEDTQKDVYNLSSDEEIKVSRNNIPFVVEETQMFDVDDSNQNQNWNKENNAGEDGNWRLKVENPKKTNYDTRAVDTQRKVRTKKNVTVVKDTQASDEEGHENKLPIDINGSNDERTERDRTFVRPVRGKRKSFQLKSESEDEEPIPETQDMDLSPDITVININVNKPKPDQNNTAESFTSKIGSVFHKIKDYISPKAKPDDVQTDKINNHKVGDEGSQSPIIRKKRKLYTEPSGRVRRPENVSGDVTEQNNAASIPKSAYILETNKKSEVETATARTGVKRLCSRPSSKESNNSDDISVANSQGSSTLLDEQGDLYSTQINEKPEGFIKVNRIHKHARTTNISEDKKKKNFDDIIDADSEEAVVVKDVKKDYQRKNNPKRHGGAATVKSENIRNFFPRIPNSNVVVNVDSDSDDPEIQFTNHSETGYKKKVRGENTVKTKIDEDENPHADLKQNSAKSFLRNYTIPRVKNPDEHKTCDIHKSSNDNSPVIPSQFVDQINAKVYTSEAYGGARPKAPRVRKVSETITSGALEEIQTVDNTDERDSVPVRNKRLRGNREKTEAAEPVRKKVSPVGRVSPVMLYPCPLCNQKFPEDIIQIHASECVGGAEEEEDEHETLAEAMNLHNHMGHNNHMGHIEEDEDHPLLPGNQLPHHHHAQRRELLHHLGNHVHFHDDEEEEQELQDLMEYQASQNPVSIEDADVHDVAKDIKISPGEPGEIDRCYICDVMIPKGVVLEQHIQQCLMEAKQQQMEVDKVGFNKVFSRVNQAPESDTPRTTRSRQQRNQDSKLVTITMDQAGHIEREEGYTSGSGGSEGTSYSSSWSEESESDSSVDENVTLSSFARTTGSAALITGPWNEKQSQSKHKHVIQSEDGVPVPDWVNNPPTSPIRSFVPISQQQDKEYFTRQFQYKQDRVERQMNKRKRSQAKGKGGRRRKRRRRKPKKAPKSKGVQNGS